MSTPHRPVPQSIESEKGLLCNFLAFPQQIGSLCAASRISRAHFHFPAHAEIFTLLNSAWANNQPLDFLTIAEAARAGGVLEDIGGFQYLSELSSFVPTAQLAAQYCEILEEKRQSRAFLKACQDGVESVLGPHEISEVLSGHQNALAGLTAPRNGQSKSFRDLLLETVESIERGEDATADILSGIQPLDDLVKMRRGNFIVISGEAKSGKTALAGTIATHAAIYQEKRVAIFTLEMTDLETVKRMMSCAGRVNVSLIGRTPNQNEINGIQRGVQSLKSCNVEIEHQCVELGEIMGRIRQMHARQPLDLIVLDYLQLVEATTGRKGETRQEIVAQISRTCKRLAAELNCVLIGLSQLNDDGKLRESRAIGQDANVILAVDRTEDGGREIRVVAQRSGASNVTAACQWLPQFSRFETP